MKHLVYFLLGAVLFASCNDAKTAKIEQQNPPVAWNGKISDFKIYSTTPHVHYGTDEDKMKKYYATSFANLSQTYLVNEEVEQNPLLKDDDFQKDTIILEGERRALFLKHTRISEEDKLFIYDFKNKIFKEFLVKDLPVMACINLYSERPSQESEEYLDWVFSGYAHFEYEYGFDLGKKYKVQADFATALTIVGRENPFVEDKIQRIKWVKIAQKDIPVSVSESYLKENNIDFQALRFKEAYQFTQGKEQVIAQDFIYTEEAEYERLVRYFIVLDTEKQSITNQFFIEAGEFAEILPFEQINEDEHNAHYFGQLFKGKSSVFLNFESMMAGCRSIYFTQAKDLPINILCDNRH